MIKKAAGDRANYGGERSHAMIYDQATAVLARDPASDPILQQPGADNLSNVCSQQVQSGAFRIWECRGRKVLLDEQ